MRIDVPTSADIEYLARHMRPKDKREFRASIGEVSDQEMLAHLKRLFLDNDNAFCAYAGPSPVAVGSVIPYDDRTIAIGMFATGRIHFLRHGLIKFIRQRLFRAYADQGFERARCLALADYKAAHRWIEALGLSKEADAPGVGKSGEDMIIFSGPLK